MTTPEVNKDQNHSAKNYVNEQRYWRVRGNLQRFMEFADYRVENVGILSEIDASNQHNGLIIAPTHSSWIDIMALGAANNIRPMRFLGKQELWKVPYIGGLARDAGAFAVDRADGGSRNDAVDTSVKLINEGEWVALFPEGTRNQSQDRRSIGKVKTGVARVALKARGETVIIPVGIGYRQGKIRKKTGFKNVGVVFGDPLMVPEGDTSGENVRSVTNILARELQVLKNHAVDLSES